MSKHSPKFLSLVAKVKSQIKECSIDLLRERIERGDKFILLDVREDHEWNTGHLPMAVHLGKGILERDIEGLAPDLHTQIVLYCGGGYRSALAAQSLQTMGYSNVISLAGGYKAWVEAGLPLEK